MYRIPHTLYRTDGGAWCWKVAGFHDRSLEYRRTLRLAFDGLYELSGDGWGRRTERIAHASLPYVLDAWLAVRIIRETMGDWLYRYGTDESIALAELIDFWNDGQAIGPAIDFTLERSIKDHTVLAVNARKSARYLRRSLMESEC